MSKIRGQAPIAHDPLVVHTCDEAVERRWCPRWGLPINQEDLLGTLTTFTVVIAGALKRLGAEIPRSDIDAYLHAWSVVGYLLGIDPKLLPLDQETATELHRAICRRQFAPSPAGREMAAALREYAADQAPRLVAGLPASMSRYLIGDDVSDLLGTPPANWTRWLFGPAGRLLRAFSLEEYHHRLLRAATARLNESLITDYLRTARGGDRPSFALPRHLADRWSIPAAAAPPAASATQPLVGVTERG